MFPSQLAYFVLSPKPISLHHAMVEVMDGKDEPYIVPEETDPRLSRTYWKLVGCPGTGCSDASFKKAFIRSFISRDRLIHYLALHLNRSSLHAIDMQEAFDTAASWVSMDENVVETTETYEEREEYRLQIKHAYSQRQKAASRARSRSVRKQQRAHSGSQSPSSMLVIDRLPGSKAKQAPKKQTASTTVESFGSAGSAGIAGDTVPKSQLQLLHDVLTRAQGALTMASKACEALRRTFHDEAEVINEARASVKTIMEQ